MFRISNVFYGAQHFVAMFGATVLAPLLMGFDPGIAIFCSGSATILFYFFLKRKVPSYLGSSFAFIAPVITITEYTAGSGQNHQLDLALGAICAAGVVFFLAGWLLHASERAKELLDILMPPAITGVVVMAVGLNLAGIAASEMQGSGINNFMGLITIMFVLLPAVFAKSFWQKIPILLGLVASYFVYWWLSRYNVTTPIDFNKVTNAAIFGLPKFSSPSFPTVTALTLTLPVVIVLIAENLGHMKALKELPTEKDAYKLDRDAIGLSTGKAFMADGLATALSPLIGGTGTTTYAENIGVMSLTRQYNPIVFLYAGLIAILCSFSPMFSALVSSIPTPIIGGIATVVFGLIAVAGARIWVKNKVDFDDARNVIVVGVALTMAAGNFTLQIGDVQFGGIATATFTALILYRLIKHSPKLED